MKLMQSLKYLVALGFLMTLSCQEGKEPTREVPQEKTPELESEAREAAVIHTAPSPEQIKKQQALKKEGLMRQQDDRQALQDLIISKKIFVEDDSYVLDYTYPYLDESQHGNLEVFNDYMAENYLNTERTINMILEDKELLCDTLGIERFRDKRIIDFKVHSTENNLISILLYKENYYSGMRHSVFMFDCLNYNVEKQEFITFDDFFKPGSDMKVFQLINATIYEKIHSGDMYYDCWEIEERDFKAYKNNFVVNGDAVEFYFDDCVICPSYTGQYSVVIPLKEIMHLIKEYQQPLLVFGSAQRPDPKSVLSSS